jgi:hypothetical protein
LMSPLSGVEALAACLRGRPPQPPDWNEIIRQANEHLVAPALGDALARQDLVRVPDDLGAYLRLIHDRNLERNTRLRAQALEAVAALNAIGIEPVLLKGVCVLLTEHNERRGLRMISDIDLQVPMARMAEVLDCLKGLGYCAMFDVGDHAYAKLFRPQDVGIIDLHHRPPGPARLYNSSRETAEEPLVVDEYRMRVPSATERAVHLIAHDMFNDGCLIRGSIDVRHLLDLRDLVAAGRVDWEIIRSRFRSGWLSLAPEVCLTNLRELLEVDVPISFGHSRTASWLYRRQILRSRRAWFRIPNDWVVRAIRWAQRKAKRHRLPWLV